MAVSFPASATATGQTTASVTVNINGFTVSIQPWTVTLSGPGTYSPSSYSRYSNNDSVTFNISGLSAGTAYTWTVALRDGTGTSYGTKSVSATTSSPPPATGTVPNVSGQTLSAAQTSFSNAGFTGGLTSSGTTTSGATSGNNGTVASQSLTAGSTANLSSSMTVVLYNYVAPPPTYTVVVDLAGGSAGVPNSGVGTFTGVASGTSWTLPTAVSKSGYDFMSFNGSYSQSQTVTITGNITFTAVWQASAPPPTYPPSWSDSSLSGTVTAGQAYSDGVTATNMNYSGSYSVVSGSLPTGISLNTSTGAVTGTPTVVGPYSFTIRATNSYGSVDASFSWTVNGGWYTYKNGAWVASTAQKYDGSQWVTGTVYKYDGSVWLVAGY